jgi:ribonucleoside-diphosphate reductase beta chain
MEVFSPEWAAAWQASINEDPAYRDAGRKWVGAVVLKAWADEGPTSASRSMLADLSAGCCREARVATPGDEARARIAIGAPWSIWAEVLAGELDPIMGLMRGRLTLEKGSLVSLVPHARGARALLAAAARLEAAIPAFEAEGLASEAEPQALEAEAGAVDDGSDDVARPGTASPQVQERVLDGGSGSASPPEPPVADAVAWVPDPRPAPTAPPISDPSPGATGPATAPSDEEPPSGRTFKSTRTGLDHDAFPMRLWHKAKKLGVWDPRDIDLERDRQDWEVLDDLERDVLLRLAALFQAGEEAVTLDLLPLMGVVAAEGRLEEEMYLTSFLWEEAKHVEAFRRFIDEVARHEGGLEQYATPSYRVIFEDELPGSLQRLRTDASPEAQARAAVVYNMIVEGVLAETGYHGYQRILEDNGIMPGMQEMVRYVKRDESRHIAYGLFLLSRLVAENGASIRALIEDEMARLLDPALEVITEVFEAYQVMPFGLELDVFTAFGLSQFQHRLGRLEKAWSAGALVTDVGESHSAGS